MLYEKSASKDSSHEWTTFRCPEQLKESGLINMGGRGDAQDDCFGLLLHSGRFRCTVADLKALIAVQRGVFFAPRGFNMLVITLRYSSGKR